MTNVAGIGMSKRLMQRDDGAVFVCDTADAAIAAGRATALAAGIPFPRRLRQPEEFAALAAHIVGNGHLKGEVIRLDGALRLAVR